ncbi:Uncharacterized conserved protein [Microbulbifer thermotolerans]|uniref:CRISPR system precrRNA processing endoribonuclease RAMP protein Cas6 n=1 Tax=Microbulbifer thermotolerans TaxID=252514 RepID=UPI0008E0C4BB|nr:CRISPR system precrRNA processing endoribonuclease RAMP protein Cas6 [Microbulbifer thermotolerans]SFD09814.1 Uncharacterized conserved protein [Microbulbifer thermotolerans]
MSAEIGLPLCRYRLQVRAEDALQLPPYAGSMLRGAFGHALRRLACMTKRRDCNGCPLQDTCPYAQLFEAPPVSGHSLQKFSRMPNPYVIEPPLGLRTVEAGRTFDFHLVLIGRALHQLPLVVLAWERALARGLGVARKRCRLLAVYPEGETEPIYRPGEESLRRHPPVKPRAVAASSVELEFLTPLRLQNNGRPLGAEALSPRALLMALARRHQLLCDSNLQQPPQTDFPALARAAETIDMHSQLRWYDWKRYSNRQQRKMALGGLVGRIRLSGDLAPFSQLLALGQWLHLGKNATFGLGHYRLSATA